MSVFDPSQKPEIHESMQMAALKELRAPPTLRGNDLLEYIRLREDKICEASFVQALIFIGKTCQEANKLWSEFNR